MKLRIPTLKCAINTLSAIAEMQGVSDYASEWIEECVMFLKTLDKDNESEGGAK